MRPGERAGSTTRAIAAYEAILAKTPALTMINMQIGRAQRMKKDYDRRHRVVQEGARRRPEQRQGEDRDRHDQPREGRLRRRREVAAAKWRSAISASREVFYNLGEVKFAKGETDEAVKYYQRAVDMDAELGQAALQARSRQAAEGRHRRRDRDDEKVIAADPNSAEAAQAKALIEQLKKG